MKKFLLIMIILTHFLEAQIISQYVETESGTTPKGLEIWNNTESTLDFSTNSLLIQQGTNGGALSDIGSTTISTGTLASGAVLVIGTANIGTYLTDNSIDVIFKEYTFSFNGDDALAVKYGSTITDYFGTPGSDPGTAWTGSSVSTANQNIKLNDGINTGFTSSSGWTDPSTRFNTVSTTPSLAGGLAGFGIPPTTPPLPVELSSFSVLPKGNGVQLTWSTATEINNFGFEVERSQKPVVSSESTTWQSIGFVKGNGNSNSPKEYSYTDNTLSNSGKFVYRLKQIDNDGTVTYSNEIETDVTVVLEYGLSQNYPNPFNPATVINYTLAEPGFVTIKVYNMLGEEVTTLINGQMEAGKHTLQFDGHNLSSGMYLYKITAGNFTQVKKMLLTK